MPDNGVEMLWLGPRRGYLTDWTTQQWVRATGRRIDLDKAPWLDGPIGETTGIGPHFFEHYALRHNLTVHDGATPRGLIRSFASLIEEDPQLRRTHPRVADFYERTSAYELSAWSEWNGAFRPMGKALATVFSRRLQQLNVPLSPLDTSRGISNRVLHLEAADGSIEAAWVRELIGTQQLLYAGAYSLAYVPGWPRPCVRVVFPLPNGSATLFMKLHAEEDGGLTLISAGEAFGDPGFYFVVHSNDRSVWVRYVPSLKEEIRVYPAEEQLVRPDHTLRIWGAVFLRIHYRLRPLHCSAR